MRIEDITDQVDDGQLREGSCYMEHCFSRSDYLFEGIPKKMKSSALVYYILSLISMKESAVI